MIVIEFAVAGIACAIGSNLGHVTYRSIRRAIARRHNGTSGPVVR